MKFSLLLPLLAVTAAAQMTEVSPERIRAHVKFLSSDLLEGRGVGARGGDLATEYLASQLALAGAKPIGDNKTYFQNFTLIGANPQPSSLLTMTANGLSTPFKWLDEFVGVTYAQIPNPSFDADAVFVGHGITAPEFKWDDYAGIDVHGKVVVLFTGEPPSDDPKFFGGKALTYYGRWTYKYEEATRHGAIGAIIIHTTPTASYGWDVVRSSWGREDQQVKLQGGEPSLMLAGWVTTEAGQKIAESVGKNVDDLLKMADTRGFKAMPLPVRFRGNLPTTIRETKTRNVVGIFEGSDPVLKSEAVIFSAHWDHLGIGPAVKGDSIYNGAADNATGCGIVLELARAWAALPQKPRRSAVFLFVSAEESGLRGSNYYGEHPVIPAAKTAVALNFDQFQPWGRTKDVVIIGADRTTVYPVIQEALKRFNFTLSPDPNPSAGHFYRSDHFSFARVGIPAFSIDGGEDILGKPAGTGHKLRDEFDEARYHQPSDEYSEDWDFTGMAYYARFGMLIGINTANLPKLPTWMPGDEFLPAREKSPQK
jgi:Zn-dependent M28 family amino/carboxypeptidase